MKYPDDFINQIICGDCIETMKAMPDNSVDLIVTDPPYNVTKSVAEIINFKDKPNGKSRKIGLTPKWDILDEKKYRAFLFSVLKEFNRILKPSGAIFIFISDKYLSDIIRFTEKLSMVYRQTCYWVKSNPVPQMRKVRFMQAVEIFCYIMKEKGHDTFRWETGMRDNVFYHPIVAGYERTEHPTQKPLWLCKELIKYSSNPNDIVLDPFAGSCTTALACHSLNRRFICIELDPNYCTIGQNRIAEAQKQWRLL